MSVVFIVLQGEYRNFSVTLGSGSIYGGAVDPDILPFAPVFSVALKRFSSITILGLKGRLLLPVGGTGLRDCHLSANMVL
jgi:hypothetical protein